MGDDEQPGTRHMGEAPAGRRAGHDDDSDDVEGHSLRVSGALNPDETTRS